MMQDLVLLIQEIGFPIFVSFYLLYRIETKLDAIHTAIIGMRE